MALDYFPCYSSYFKKTKNLSDSELGRLFRALMKYQVTGEAEQLNGREGMAFDFMVDDIDRAAKSYEDKCDKLRTNGRKAVVQQLPPIATNCPQLPPDATNCHQMPPDATQSKSKDKSKSEYEDISADADTAPARKKAFVPPSVEEVRAYCAERGNTVDAQRFVDYYSSNGWMVGKNKMKDWKAAIRSTWERDDASQKKPSAGIQRNGARQIDDDERAAILEMMEEESNETSKSSYRM